MSEVEFENEAVAVRFVPAADVADLETETLLFVELGGREIVIARVDEEFFAFDAICTHAFVYLDQGVMDGYVLFCPLHSGGFDVRNGEPVCLPVTEPLKSYKTIVKDGKVLVQLV